MDLRQLQLCGKWTTCVCPPNHKPAHPLTTRHASATPSSFSRELTVSKPRYSALACQSARVACSPFAPIRRQAAFTAELGTVRFERCGAPRAREGGAINASGKQERGKICQTFCAMYGKNGMSALALEVPLSAVGTVLRLNRDGRVANGQMANASNK